ncbi:MAG: MFS transporter [Proteobacteria bacterium]|nr:MFS transporter [Pseudomonadota bacterium]
MKFNSTIITTLPALKDHRNLRFFALGLLYVAQGLPIGLFQVAIPAWMASQGLSAAQVGTFIAIAFLPWSFKLLAGPVMDRFSFPPMGRRRPWVLGAQAGIVLALLLIVVVDPDLESGFMLLAGLGFCANSFGAIQDVAVDGMAIDILEEDERARANAFMFGGQTIGVSGASVLGSIALAQYGLGAAALILSAVVALIMLVPLLLRERKGERLLPWSKGVASVEALESVVDNWRSIFSTLIKALLLPMSLLLILLEGLSRMSGGILAAVSPVLVVQDLGWLQTEYSQWIAITGIAAAVFGVLMGPVIDMIGAKIALSVAIAIRASMFAGVAMLQSWWQDPMFFKVAILLNGLTGQIVTIAIIALFMQLTFQKVAATQFAVYMALANLTLAMGSALVAPMDGVLDYSQMFFVAAGLNVLFLILWPLVDLDRHSADMQALKMKLQGIK